MCVITLFINIEILKKASALADMKEIYALLFVIGGSTIITLLIYLFSKKSTILQDKENK